MNGIELRGIAKAYGKNAPVIENMDLMIKKDSFTVLLGPSGCGKSTVLRMIAGLEKETAGQISIDGVDMRDIAPGDRQIAMVFQNYALYPNMTVEENMEFGLKNIKVPRLERKKRISDIAEMVGLTEYLNRKPQHLSGGQRQRVALARAIVKKPKFFLMDEPLSNLDAKLRAQIRTDLIELHRNLGTTFVYVTHDQVEAMSMGTDIVLMEEGKIRQQASPQLIYSSPSNLFAALFIGSPPMNVLRTDVVAQFTALVPKNAASVGFRPEKVILYDDGENVSADGHIRLKGTLVAREILGDQVLYKLKTDWGDVFVKNAAGAMVEYGHRTFSVDPGHLYCFDENGDTVAAVVEPVKSRKHAA